MKRILSFILCAIVVISSASCSKDKSSSSTTPTNADGSEVSTTAKSNNGKTLSLYFSYSDSLDPYKAESSGNKAICALLFDPLVKLDNDFNAQNRIASEVNLDGKTITVTLGTHNFSDGSLITADDVIYSIKRCKSAKKGDFVGQLENVESYKAENGKVVITLKRYDKNAVNLLDFPILKKNTHNKTNKDGKHIPPIGSGRYVFVDNKGNYSLKGNENYYSGKPICDITLNNSPDYEATEYLIRSSSIDVYYSGFDNKEMPTLSGKSGSVNLTNLVYLGINQQRAFLGDSNVRCALSYAVDRADIAEKCYYSLAVPALSLYHSKNKNIENKDNIFYSEDNSLQAVEMLKKSGYNQLNNEGYYKNKDGNIITLTLLYNKDNNTQSMAASLLAKNIKACGINIVLDKASASEYKSRVNNGDYDIYLAELRLTKSFDYSVLLSFPKNVPYNYEPKEKEDTEETIEEVEQTKQEQEPKKNNDKDNNIDFNKIYEQYLKGEKSVDEMLDSFVEAMPFVPIAFRLGTVNYSDKFSTDLISTAGDPYYNIEKISLK